MGCIVIGYHGQGGLEYFKLGASPDYGASPFFEYMNLILERIKDD